MAEEDESQQPTETVLLEVTASALRGGGLITHNSVKATNRGLRFRDPKMLGLTEDVTEIPYNKIESLKKKGGLRGTTLIMSSGTFGTIELGGISGGDANKIIAIYKKYRDVQTPQAAPQQASTEDPVEQLAKLKKMVEAGLITEEEYNTKKAEILARM